MPYFVHPRGLDEELDVVDGKHALPCVGQLVVARAIPDGFFRFVVVVVCVQVLDRYACCPRWYDVHVVRGARWQLVVAGRSFSTLKIRQPRREAQVALLGIGWRWVCMW